MFKIFKRLTVLSVIVPTLNEAENISKLMSFFDKLDDNELEIIISDSPLSSDKATILTGAGNFKYHKASKSGRAVQMNEGVSYSTGNVLCFLHADVMPPATFKDDIYKAIESSYEFGFFAYKYDPTTTLLDFNAQFTCRDGVFAGGGDQIHFMTRSVYDLMKGYNEKYSIMEDFDFVRRFRKLNKSIMIIRNKATVSSRKYLHNSFFKVNLVNLFAFLMFLMNTEPSTIKKIYHRLLN